MCSGASLVGQLVKNLPTMQETRFDSRVGKIPWRRKWQPTPVFLQATIHGSQESDTTQRPNHHSRCSIK